MDFLTPLPTDPCAASPHGGVAEQLRSLLAHIAAIEHLASSTAPDGPLTELVRAGQKLQVLLERGGGGAAGSPRPLGQEHETLLARQLEHFSSDLRTLRKERNAARSALGTARLDALQRLVAAAELKDDDTGEHIIRMGYFSALIAQGTGRDETYCKTLLHASRMHDIGKIGIPDAVLKKPGKLTDEEWRIMRTHPQIGAALLSNTTDPLYNMAEQVALAHHEKFDGTGYPNGLRGADIPLCARIVALADFFDAVTMDRCYRRAMTDEKAIELIRALEGSHFDPMVVQGFFRALPEIMETRTRVNEGKLQ